MATLPMTAENRAASSDDGDARCAKRGLQALNFFMADMQAGILGKQFGPNRNGGAS